MTPAQFGVFVLTTSAGIMDHEEARRKKVGGKVGVSVAIPRSVHVHEQISGRALDAPAAVDLVAQHAMWCFEQVFETYAASPNSRLCVCADPRVLLLSNAASPRVAELGYWSERAAMVQGDRGGALGSSSFSVDRTRNFVMATTSRGIVAADGKACWCCVATLRGADSLRIHPRSRASQRLEICTTSLQACRHACLALAAHKTQITKHIISMTLQQAFGHDSTS